MNAPTIVKAHEGEPVSPELAPLLLAVYDELAKRSTDLRPLKSAIEHLLTFLASAQGRTNANCWATDLFFAMGEGWGDVDWEHVPEALSDILGDMGSALHDTVQTPEMAENFECTPEQLLTRLYAFEISRGALLPDLQAKLSTYLTYALDGQLLEEYPQLKGKPIIFQLSFAHEPGHRERDIIDIVRR